ncbi:DNA topoisomerase IB [Microbacterium horticulturae]|uniref:DNA topoisomerase n=1 Tax=Microbacterium horticulturae TaxID=3028316 RepID=A0ABY8BZ89_9MICO|nr:DNA topoisomerase IB [Microbacterium sp. KACC 23027]WEG09521.1 DNA topoisomerase IB [Microbacterium sp. KACC 23027]
MRLHEVTPREDSGFTRVVHGKTVRFEDPAGRPVPTKALARAEGLVLPPAWTHVWISSDPNGHIQAVGIDAAGRQQYVYHPEWIAARDRDKFERSLALAAAMPGARARVTRHIRAEGLGRERVLAAAFRLLDGSALRIGSEEYLSRYGTRGLTTLRCKDAVCDGTTVTFDFVGKGGLQVRRTVQDADIVALMAEMARSSPRARLFAYPEGRRRVPLRAADVNDYVRLVTADDVTAKDFRTLHGTIVAARTLARIGPLETKRERAAARRSAVEETAGFLGNTPAVAQRSYIDPRVFRRYDEGDLLDLRGSPERALRRLLS